LTLPKKLCFLVASEGTFLAFIFDVGCASVVGVEYFEGPKDMES